MSSFDDIISSLQEQDPRYEREAYLLVRKSLDFTIQQVEEQQQKGPGKLRHISGQELLDGVRQYTLDQYGPMSYVVLEHWGLKRCEDIGEVVFNLVDCGVLGKTEADDKNDFANGYDFKDAFVKPFEP